MLRFNTGPEFPDEGGEFPGHADFDFVVMKFAFPQGAEAVAQTGLGLPGQLPDPTRRPLLARR